MQELLRDKIAKNALFSNEYRSGFQMVRPFEIRTLLSGFQMFLSGSGYVRLRDCPLNTGLNCPVFRWHLKTGPFDNRTHIHHLKTGLVRYSDGYCSYSQTLQNLDHYKSDLQKVWISNVSQF